MGRRRNESKDSGKVTKKHHRRSARLAALKIAADRNTESLTEASQPQPSSRSEKLSMKLVTAFPSTVAVNRAMSVPVIVLFDREHGHVPSTEDVWAFASLVEESSGDSANEDLLQGQRADSVHTFTAYQADLREDFAYASFPNLRITQSGRYRLRVTAIDMKNSSSGGRVLPAITSDAFDVVESSQADAADDSRVNDALAHLRQLGIAV